MKAQKKRVTKRAIKQAMASRGTSSTTETILRYKNTYIVIFINIHIILLIRFNYICSTSKSACGSNEVVAPGPLALVPIQAPSSNGPTKRVVSPRIVKEITEAKKPKKGATIKKRSNGGVGSNKGKKKCAGAASN
jgi:hypothetical protein